MADGRLLFDTELDAGGFKKGLGGIESLARTGLGGVGKIAGKAAQAVKTSFAIGVAAVGGFVAYSIKAGSEFEAAMAEVGAISGATAEDMEKLTDKAKEMGATTKFSASESADALKYMAMAGWDTEKMLSGLPGIMNLAAASGESLGTVSDIVTDAMTAFGLEASEAGDFADLLAMTSSKANTNVSMLGESFKYVAPLAGALNYEAEDVAVALGLMANAGIKGGQAGTSLRAALTRMVKPTKESAAVMGELGISMTDSAGNMKPLDAMLLELRGKFSGLSEAEQASAAASLFGQESMAGMLAIINAAPADFDKLTASVNNSTGAAEEMARVMNDNLQGDITLLKSALEGVGISLYEGIDNPARDVVQSFTGYMGQLQDAIDGPSDKVNEFLDRTGMTADEAGAVIEDNRSMIERIAGTFGTIIGDMAVKLAEAVPQIVSGAKELINGLFTGLTENAGVISEAATALITGFVDVIVNYGSQFIALGLEIISNIMAGLATSAPELVNTIQDALTNIMNAVTENLPLILESGREILTAILNGIIESVPQMAQTAADLIGTFITFIAESLPLIIESGVEIINAIITAITENMPMIADAAIQILNGVVTGIVENLPLIIPAVIDMIDALINTIIENFPLLLDAGMQILTAIVQGIVENLSEIIPGVLAMVSAIADALISNISLLIDLGIQIILALVDGLIEALPWIIAEVPRIINAFADAIYSALPQILALGLKIIVELGKGIIKNIPLIIANAGEIFRAILNVFTLSNMFSLGGKLIDFLKQGISNFGPNLMSAVSKMFNGVITSIKNIFTGGTGTGTGLIQNIINGVGQIIPNLISKVSTMGADIITAIKTALAGALSVGVGLVTDLIGGVSSMFFSITSKAGEIAGATIKAFTDAFAGAFDIGKNLITGLWKGIGSVKNWIGDKIKGFANGITSSIKGFFGIKSPSKLFEKEIGAMLPPGIGKGIEKATPKLLSNIRTNLKTIKDEFKDGLMMDGGLTANAESTVKRINEYDFTVDGAGKKLAFANNINVVSVLDGREVGRGSARFVSAEQSLALKRRG